MAAAAVSAGRARPRRAPARLSTALALALGASTVHAGGASPTPPAAPAHALPADFTAALKEGRALAHRKRWAEAEAAFARALAIVPDQPAAAAERTLALLALSRLADAKAAAERAVAHATTPTEKASAEYNLGLVEEAEGAPDRALAAYRRSVELHETHAARRRIDRLARWLPATAARAAGDTFPSLTAACAALEKEEKRFDYSQGDEPGFPAVLTFACAHRDPVIVRRRLPAGFDEVRLFLSATSGGHGAGNHVGQGHSREVFFNLAVRTGTRWHLFADVDHGLDGNEGGFAVEETTPTPKGLVIRYHIDESASNMFASTHSALLVLGRGSDGAPALVGPVLLRDEDGTFPYGENAVSEESSSTRTVRFDPTAGDGGALVLGPIDTIEKENDTVVRKRREGAASRLPVTWP